MRQDIALLLAQAEANVVRKQQARDDADQAQSDLEDLLAQQASDKAGLEQEKAVLERELTAAQRESDHLETRLADLAARQHGLETAEAAEQQRIADEEARRKAEEEAQRVAAAKEAERQAEAERQREAEQAAQAAQDRPAPSPEPTPALALEPAPAPAPQPAPAPSSGYLSSPSRAGVTSTFGYRMHPILGYSRLHAGIDYAGACGSPVYAPAAGVVIGASSTQGGGNKVLIDHGVQRSVNLVTTYSHLSGYAVTSGPVRRGQVVAYVGSTGLSSGCHLHFETRENGIPVDPFTLVVG